MSPETTSAQDNRPASEAGALCLLPAHVIVLALLAIVALVAGHDAAGAYRAGQEAGSFGPEVRRAVGFGLLFNAAIAIALVLGWLIEFVAMIVQVARGAAPARRALARAGLALLPLAILVVGHRIFNPWLPDLIRQVGQLTRGG